MTTQVELSTAQPGAPGGAPVVVVGVDGSAAAHQALLFAAHEAQLRGAVLHVVAAHDLSAAAFSSAGFGAGLDTAPLEDGMRRAAQGLVDDAAVAVAEELDGAPLHVQTLVVQGRPSSALLEAARGAALLVVGARGAGALTRLLLGSTSTEVVHGAHLPVTVVPTDPPSS